MDDICMNERTYRKFKGPVLADLHENLNYNIINVKVCFFVWSFFHLKTKQRIDVNFHLIGYFLFRENKFFEKLFSYSCSIFIIYFFFAALNITENTCSGRLILAFSTVPSLRRTKEWLTDARRIPKLYS